MLVGCLHGITMPHLPSPLRFSQQPVHWSPCEHPGQATLLLSAHCPQSDPLKLEVRPCHSPASQALSMTLRAPYSPGSFSSVSYHGPAQGTVLPSGHVSPSEPLFLCPIGLEGSTSKNFVWFSSPLPLGLGLNTTLSRGHAI